MLPAQPGAGQGQEAGTWTSGGWRLVPVHNLQCPGICPATCHGSHAAPAHWSYIITTNNYLGTFHFDTHLKQIKTLKPISSRLWV